MRLDEESLRRRFAQHQKSPPGGTWEGIQRRIAWQRRRRHLLIWGLPALLITVASLAPFLQSVSSGLVSSTLPGPQTAVLDTPATMPSPALAFRQKAAALHEPYALPGAQQKGSQSGAQTQKAAAPASAPGSQALEPRLPNPERPPESRASRQAEAPATKGSGSTAEQKVAAQQRLRPYPLQLTKLKPYNLIPEAASLISSHQPADTFAAGSRVTVNDAIKDRWQASLQGRAFVSQFQYRQKEGTNEAALEEVRSAESAGRGWGIDAQLHYRVGSQLTVTAGLGYEYGQQDLKYPYRSRSIDTILPDGADTAGFPGSGGNNTNNQPPTIDTTFEKEVIQHRNAYHRLSLPIAGRFQVLEKGRWQLFIEGGVRLTYLLAIDARQVRPGQASQQGPPLQEVDRSLTNGLNLRYRLRTGIGYELADQWMLTANPAFEGQVFSVYNTPGLPERRMQQFGLSLGLQKPF